MNKRKTTISFENFTGVILNDGKQIRDDISGLCFNGVFSWLKHLKKHKNAENLVGKHFMLNYYNNLHKEYNADCQFIFDDVK